MNRTYRHMAAKLGQTQQGGQDVLSPNFPLERARLKGIYFLISTTAVGIIGYGVALMTKTVSPVPRSSDQR